MIYFVTDFLIISGRDGTFAMYEDEGNTTAYADGVMRSTYWTWDDKARVLSWTVDTAAGYVGSSTDFVTVSAVLFVGGAASPVVARTVEIGVGGFVQF